MTSTEQQVFNGDTQMRSPRAVWTPGDTTPVVQRLLINWPLEDIDLDVPIVEADLEPGSPWPPQHADKRTERLDIYADLYRGDSSSFHQDPEAARVFVNWFRRFTHMMSTQVVRDLEDIDAIDPVMRTAARALQYGRSYPFTANGELLCFDTRQCWRDEDDEDALWVVRPYVTRRSPNGDTDMADIYLITPTGGFMWSQGLQNGRWTDERSSEEAVNGDWATVETPPVLDEWGQPSYDDMIPLVVTVAMTMTSYRRVVAANEAPTTLFPFSATDVTRKLALPGDPNFAAQWQSQEIQQAVKQITLNDTAWVPAANFVPLILEWGGNMEASRNLIDILNRGIRTITGVPTTSEAEGTEQPSGVAMERMDWQRTWDVAQLTRRIQAALDTLGVAIEIPIPAATDRATPPTEGTDNQGNRDADPDS